MSRMEKEVTWAGRGRRKGEARASGMATTERAPLLSSGGVPTQRDSAPPRSSQSVRVGLGMMETSVASMALGVCGLGVTWQVATQYLLAGKVVKVAADIISLVSFNVGTTLFLAYMTKVAMMPKAVIEDALSADGNANLPCLAMALMMMAWWLDIHGFHGVGRVLWVVAVVAHVGLLLLFCVRHLSKREWDPMTPAWMIPTVGIAMAAGTGASIGIGAWTGVFFWLALAAFIVQYPAVLYRVHVHPSIISDEDELLYPLFAAPAAVLLSSWISMGGHQGHALTHFLFLVEMVSIVLVAMRLPHLTGLASLTAGKAPTTAYAFPCDVAAKACVLYTHLYLTGSTVMVVCCWFFVAVATAAVCISLTKFVRNSLDALAAAKQFVPGERVVPQENDYEL
mmetsp:Transcript_4068/g.9281  ORF Transcript_4068/g.9281 Transcript_4068/m.9281 type:complete len:396 (+) Transcript_4068:2-1189(+)